MTTKSASGKKAGHKLTKGSVEITTINDFYESALDDAERELLPDARKIQGIDEEIAVLRVKLHSAVKARPENLPLMLRGIGLLVKAVSARYRRRAPCIILLAMRTAVSRCIEHSSARARW